MKRPLPIPSPRQGVKRKRTAPGKGTLKYEYSPLPGPEYTRILTLHPGRDEETLSCDLYIGNSDKIKNSYTAISYVWGNPSKTTKLLCRGQSICITVNAANALRALRDPVTPKPVWMDAVCINQHNKDEKSHQVKKIGTIFNNASEVVVWLGHDVGGIAEDCFGLITSTNDYLDSQLSIYGSKNQIPTLAKPYPICDDYSRWVKVQKLLQLPWFERLWVIHEAGLAKVCTMRWGRHAIDFAQIVELALWLVSREDIARLTGHIDVVRITDVYREIQCNYKNSKTWRRNLPLVQARSKKAEGMCPLFVDTLLAASRMQATDKRDHVFAFLGSSLALKPDGKLIVEPNYTKAPHEVFFETACSLLQVPNEAQYLLSRVKHLTMESLNDTSMPSWVPRWDTPVEFTISRPKFWYRAGGDSQFVPEVRPDRTLAAEGIFFDRVVFVSRVIEKHNTEANREEWDEEYRAEKVPFIDALWDECIQATQSTETQFEDAFSWTLARAYPAPQTRISDKQHRAEFSAYRHLVRSIARCDEKLEAEVKPASKTGSFPRNFLHRLNYCANLRVAIMESGRLSLVPHLTRAGDRCCIFPGVPVPFILRKYDKQEYKFVGESYVHGVMKGEIMDELSRGKLGRETLFLS